MTEPFTDINTLGLIFTLIMSILLFLLPKHLALFPILISACYITLGQVVVIGSLHFYIIRIMIFLGFIRILIRKEYIITFNNIDKLIIIFGTVSSIIYFIRRLDSQSLIYASGFFYNTLGFYFIFRIFTNNDENNYYKIFYILALIITPLAFSMLIENVTGKNLFSIFGGIPEFTMVRDGKLRCQGPFSHPILAGTFGATSIPFFVSLWRKNKKLAKVGLISGTIITLTSGSSGPLLVYLSVIIGIIMWKVHNNMRLIRWIIFLVILGLHFIMKGPVWALIGKIGSLIGGTGWHRYALIDAAIEHIDEWWLLGTDYTRHWLPTGVTWSAQHTDITNHFIGIGIRGGLISLIIFISILIYNFKKIGLKIKENSIDFTKKFTIWCLGVSLFAHMMAFLSVSYFDQIIVFWYFLLALIGSLNIEKQKS